MPPLAITALFAALGLLFVAMAQPLIRRAVAPNGAFGLRTPATLADETIWYDANARCGRDLQTLGLLLLGGALLLPWGLGALGGRLLVAVLLGGLVLVAVRGHWAANRLLSSRVQRIAAEDRPTPVDAA